MLLYDEVLLTESNYCYYRDERSRSVVAVVRHPVEMSEGAFPSKRAMSMRMDV